MKLILLIPILLLCACATNKVDEYSQYLAVQQEETLFEKQFLVELEAGKSLDFRGVYDSRNAVDHGSVLYAGDAGVGGLLAQVLVHAAISKNAQNAKLSQQQLEANAVLAPMQPMLEGINQTILIHDSEGYHFSSNNSADIVLESQPIFFISQNMRSISLKHKVKAHQLDTSKTLYENSIEVLSSDLDAEEPYELLGSDDGARLKEIAKNLYEYSLSLAVADIKGEYQSGDSKQKSFRVYQGDKLRVERGASVDQGQDKSVIRNLRGWLVAFPLDAEKTH